MKAINALLMGVVLLSAGTAWAQYSEDNQPKVPHAFYGRDGFWHCDAGYRAGEDGGCEATTDGWKYSVYTRMQRAESEDRAQGRTTEQ
jgi:hypothetical protein